MLPMSKSEKEIISVFALCIFALIIFYLLVAMRFFAKDNIIVEDSISKVNSVDSQKEVYVSDTVKEKESETDSSSKISDDKVISLEQRDFTYEKRETNNISSRSSQDVQTVSSQEVKQEPKQQVQQATSNNSKAQQSQENNVKQTNTKQTQQNTSVQTTQVQQSVSTQTKTQQNQSLPSIGTIKIPKTNVNMRILSNVSVAGMETDACFLYSTGSLNKDGNTVIVGHNYRNGKLFSNNNKLQIGDTINITTSDGVTVTYTIYSKFVTTPEDVSFYRRDTNNKPEITLSCCSDDENSRIVILARP